MFDALVNGRIDCGELTFEVAYYDIEELNRRAEAGETDVSKISYALLPEIQSRYTLLDSGSALGRGNGPVFVARQGTPPDSIRRVAVPGLHTTANALMSRLYPSITQKEPVLFSEIAPAVARGEYDAGVLIHEGRFVYRKLGLELIADLGELWESRTGLPLPPSSPDGHCRKSFAAKSNDCCARASNMLSHTGRNPAPILRSTPGSSTTG